MTRLRKESEVFAESTRRLGLSVASGVAASVRLSALAPRRNDAAESSITYQFECQTGL